MSDEKRENERSQVTLKVDYKRLNTFFADYTRNISKGGTFIKTGKPLPIGTEFMFVLSLPSREEQLHLLGEVVWTVEESDATDQKPAGMGIRFKFRGEAERNAVHAWVERLMTETLGEHISQRLLANPKPRT
jgi:type IV pilus assembly protein PilZ